MLMKMPKKRTTKNQVRPNTTVADHEKVGEGMSKEQKMAKLEMLLEDFDAEVNTRVSKMRREIDKMCSAVTKLYRIELLKLPKKYRDMKCEEYFALGGNINSAALKEVDIIVDSLNETKVKENLHHSTCQTIIEEDTIPIKNTSYISNTMPMEKSNGRRVLTTRNQSVNMPPPTTNRLRAKPKIRTPFSSLTLNKPSWSTPAVTPKFDPSLPLTSSLTRQARVGEKIMSLSGSPLVNTVDLLKNPSDAVIILADGQTLPLSDSPFIDQLDSQTRKKMQLLHKKLGALLVSPNA